MWQSLSKGHFSPQLVFPIGKLEQDKSVWNDYSLHVMSTVSNSVEQCRTVSTVSTVSTTVIALCYLHLRWYFCCKNGSRFFLLIGGPLPDYCPPDHDPDFNSTGCLVTILSTWGWGVQPWGWIWKYFNFQSIFLRWNFFCILLTFSFYQNFVPSIHLLM